MQAGPGGEEFDLCLPEESPDHLNRLGMESPFTLRHSAPGQHVCSVCPAPALPPPNGGCAVPTGGGSSPACTEGTTLEVYVGYHCHVVQVDQGVMPLHVWQDGLEKTAIISRQLFCQHCSWPDQESNASLPSHRAPQPELESFAVSFWRPTADLSPTDTVWGALQGANALTQL